MIPKNCSFDWIQWLRSCTEIYLTNSKNVNIDTNINIKEKFGYIQYKR